LLLHYENKLERFWNARYTERMERRSFISAVGVAFVAGITGAATLQAAMAKAALPI
jgi:hypothetical protein